MRAEGGPSDRRPGTRLLGGLGWRHGALTVVLAALATYYLVAPHLWDASTWWDVAWLALVVVPAVFSLVYLVVPLWRAQGLLLVGLAFGVFAATAEVADLDVVANFAKLGALTALGFWFLSYFENLSWIALVAGLVPWVDAYSVWRGPTRHIVEEREEVFTTLSIAFPLPGERASANLGLPDLLFFALFLAASVRFRLRPRWTWLALTASFGVTMALAVGLDVAGLPALPGLSLGFFLPNADLIWKQLRDRGRG